jgi:F0F1-type ATP synthase membrane subunit a
LSVRIFANMMAGHILLKVIAIFAWSGYFFGNFSWFLKRYLALVVLGGMILMESAIALVQGYVFTLLTCLYIKDIFSSH